MTLHAFRLPFGFDPLIAEAKRRMRRRRLLAGAAFLVFALIVAGATFGLGSQGPGGSPPGPSGAATGHSIDQGGSDPHANGATALAEMRLKRLLAERRQHALATEARLRAELRARKQAAS